MSDRPASLDHHARKAAQRYCDHTCMVMAHDGGEFWDTVDEIATALSERFPMAPWTALSDSARDELHDEIVSRGYRFS